MGRGVKAKQAADWALDSCSDVGNVRTDLFQCATSAAMTHPANGHLNRYFLLICFCSYVCRETITAAPPTDPPASAEGDSDGPRLRCFICGKAGHIARECEGSFAQWMSARPELQFILDHAKIE